MLNCTEVIYFEFLFCTKLPRFSGILKIYHGKTSPKTKQRESYTTRRGWGGHKHQPSPEMSERLKTKVVEAAFFPRRAVFFTKFSKKVKTVSIKTVFVTKLVVLSLSVKLFSPVFCKWRFFSSRE